MRTSISNINKNRLKINSTKISPVIKDNSLLQLSLIFSEQDRKLTLAIVNDYLQTAQFEETNI